MPQEAFAHPDRITSDPRFTYYNIPLLRVDADDISNKTISKTIETSLGDLYIWMFENSGTYYFHKEDIEWPEGHEDPFADSFMHDYLNPT